MKMTPSRYLWLNVLLLVFCLFIKTYDRIARPVVGTDNYWQLAAAESFLNGNGLTIANCDTADFSKITRARLVGWPPGYPLVAAPVFSFFQKDPLKTEMLVFFLAVCLHFGSWFLIFKRMGGIYWQRVLPLFLIVSIFLANPFKAMGAPTDALSLACFSLAAFFFYRIYEYKQQESEAPFAYLAGLSLAAYLCSFFRYAYYPVTLTFVALFLLLLLVFGKRYLRPLLIHGGIVAVLLAAQLWYDMSGPNGMQRVGSLSSKGLTLHFEFLKYFDAVFFNAVFNDNLVYKSLGFMPPIKEFVVKAFALMFPVGMLLFLLLTAGILSFWNKLPSSNRLRALLADKTGILYTLGLAASLINVAFITLLSLKSNSAKEEYVWTWIMLTRYFVLALFFIQLGAVLVIVTGWEEGNKTIKTKLLVYGLSFFLLAGGLLGASQLVRLNMKMSPTDYKANLRVLYNPPGAINDMLEFQQKLRNSKEPLAFAPLPLSENNYLSPIVAQTGVPFFERDRLMAGKINTSKPVKALVAVRTNAEDEMTKKYCENAQAEVYAQLKNAGITVYALTILP